jgi:tetratricopeptide (TPR) repeat protein
MSDNGEGTALAQRYTNEGIALARRGEKQQAVARFQEALRVRPEHAKAHNNLSIALAELGRGGEAKECWQRALQIEPAYAEAHFNLALACAAQRQVAEAVEHYALRSKPDYADAYNNLGLLQTEQGRHGEGVVLLRKPGGCVREDGRGGDEGTAGIAAETRIATCMTGV